MIRNLILPQSVTELPLQRAKELCCAIAKNSLIDTIASISEQRESRLSALESEYIAWLKDYQDRRTELLSSLDSIKLHWSWELDEIARRRSEYWNAIPRGHALTVEERERIEGFDGERHVAMSLRQSELASARLALSQLEGELSSRNKELKRANAEIENELNHRFRAAKAAHRLTQSIISTATPETIQSIYEELNPANT